jgi:acyl carrier protein
MPQMNEMTVAGLRKLAADAFEVDPDDVTEDAAFYEDLGIDSLQKIEFVVRVERLFGVRLTDEEAAGLQNFGNVLSVLRSRGMSLAD